MVGYWSKMVGFGPIWSDLVPTVVKQSQQKYVFPKMTQKGLEMVPVASGGPGNLFLYNNNIFLYHKTDLCSYYLLPLFPCQISYSLSGCLVDASSIGLEWRKRREIGEKSCPKLSFPRKHIKHISKNKCAHLSKKTKTAGIHLSFH